MADVITTKDGRLVAVDPMRGMLDQNVVLEKGQSPSGYVLAGEVDQPGGVAGLDGGGLLKLSDMTGVMASTDLTDGALLAPLASPTFTGTVTVPGASHPTDAVQKADVTTVIGAVAPRFLTAVEPASSQCVLTPALPIILDVGRGILASDTTLYAVYLGRTVAAITSAKLNAYLTASGIGTQAAEVALFSTPTAPAGVPQTLTRIGAGMAMASDLTAGRGAISETLAQAVAVGTYLWAGIRVHMAGVGFMQPTFAAVCADLGSGQVLFQGSAAAITATASYAAPSVPTDTLGALAPYLQVMLA